MQTSAAASATGQGERARAALRTGLCLLLVPPVLGVLCLVAIVLGAAGASQRTVHRFYLLFSRIALRMAGIPIEVHGREHVGRDRAFVVVCNHESALDPFPLLLGLDPLLVRFVVKDALMRVPLFGAALRATGNVRVLRTDTAGDVQRLREGMAERDPGVSLLFFAEGTRSRDGSLRPFKTGPFATALASGLPVLPVALAGSFRIWRPETLWLRPGPVALEIGAPLPVAGRGLDERATLRDAAHEAVAALRERAQMRLERQGFDPESTP